MSVSVFFFGGYLASQPDMTLWLKSARAQKADIDFSAFPWPRGANSGADSAVKTFTSIGQYASAVAAIQASTADTIYIVGHSSGCAIANAVDRGLKDTSKIVLVALDGFVPDSKQRARSSTQVWAAESGAAKSLHYQDLKNVVGGSLQVYQGRQDCTTKLALHFSLVNTAATDKVVDSIPNGYVQCRANLDWL